ncbi:unnamed protein product, partial [Ectocarpus sp. 12 AP-2014]
MRPREGGALLPQDRSPMANSSFLIYQRWLKIGRGASTVYWQRSYKPKTRCSKF